MAASDHLSLRHISIPELSVMPLPTLQIKTEEDVHIWKETQGYCDYGLFLRRLNESVVGHSLPWMSPSPSKATASMLLLFEKLDRWIEEIPPLPTPQRFGNLAFRSWGKRLEDEATLLLTDLLPSELSPAIPHLTPYFVTSFGSFSRMDYGTGHETSFALFLLCLTLIRFYEPNPEQERDLVLITFLRYLRLCWKLQDVYRLEPAGSHGVWGLDDYSFLGYIFGSAQLRESDVPVSAVLHPPLPPSNLYFICISRIHEVKSGPFHEHSSQLHSIACGVPRWAKVNSGLLKMYEAEVLGKRVVVQHIPLGGMLKWNSPSAHSEHLSMIRQSSHTLAPGAATSAPSPAPNTVTAAPWGPADHAVMSRTAVPWATKHLNQTIGSTHRNTGPFVQPRVPVGITANTSLCPTKNPVSDGADSTLSK